MTDPYETYTDVFMSSLAGEMSGLSKEQFLALLKTKFPNEADFVATMEALAAHAGMQIEQAQAKLKPGQTLGIGYPLEVPRGPLH